MDTTKIQAMSFNGVIDMNMCEELLIGAETTQR